MRALERMAAAANDTGVLGVSLIAPPQDAPTSPDQSDYLGRSIGQINILVHGVAAAACSVMFLATVRSRHVALSKKRQ